jgi:putative flippase GtrA
VNEGIFILLRSRGVFYLYASAIAIEISIISNFCFNDLWTFRDRRRGHVAVRMVKFNALMIVGLIAQLAVVYSVTTYLGIDSTISNLVGIGGAFIIRYFLSTRYAWMKERIPEEKLSEAAGPTHACSQGPENAEERRGHPDLCPPETGQQQDRVMGELALQSNQPVMA